MGTYQILCGDEESWGVPARMHEKIVEASSLEEAEKQMKEEYDFVCNPEVVRSNGTEKESELQIKHDEAAMIRKDIIRTIMAAHTIMGSEKEFHSILLRSIRLAGEMEVFESAEQNTMLRNAIRFAVKEHERLPEWRDVSENSADIKKFVETSKDIESRFAVDDPAVIALNLEMVQDPISDCLNDLEEVLTRELKFPCRVNGKEVSLTRDELANMILSGEQVEIVSDEAAKSRERDIGTQDIEER